MKVRGRLNCLILNDGDDPPALADVQRNAKIKSIGSCQRTEGGCMAKIPSRKFPAGKKKLASRKLPTGKRKISGQPAKKSARPDDTADQEQDEPEPLGRPTDEQARQEIVAELKHRTARTMIHTILDACQFALEGDGEPQSSSCLASNLKEMKLWRASEADVRDALTKDIGRFGEESLFVRIDADTFTLRAWQSR